jgi:hypothetical protein
MSPDSLLLSLRQHHRRATAQLLAEFGVSRATLMRAVRAAGASVLTIGRARRTSYAARRLLRGNGAPLSVFRVDRQGSAEQAGSCIWRIPMAVCSNTEVRSSGP